MKKLLTNKSKYYTPKLRPSGHDISDKFSDNGGAIPSNLLKIPNSESNSRYLKHCNELQVKSHPARFPSKLPAFFIKFLTDEKDMVVDIFAGSNTTGEAAETLRRKWISVDNDISYVAASSFRFLNGVRKSTVEEIYKKIKAGELIDLREYEPQELNLFE